MATWPSWPQACITPSVPEAKGASRISVSGSASMSARQAMVRPGLSPCSTPTTAVVSATPGTNLQAGGLQAFRDDLGGTMFLETQFGVAMEITPQGKEAFVPRRQLL